MCRPLVWGKSAGTSACQPKAHLHSRYLAPYPCPVTMEKLHPLRHQRKGCSQPSSPHPCITSCSLSPVSPHQQTKHASPSPTHTSSNPHLSLKVTLQELAKNMASLPLGLISVELTLTGVSSPIIPHSEGYDMACITW